MISKKIFILFQCLAFLLISILTAIGLSKYSYNFTAFLYVWEGFYKLNPQVFFENFVIHTQGGYDGQFFYLIAHYLFSNSSPPILDAFELRFRRIGLSLLGGSLGKIFGWKNYALVTFVMLWFFHLFSSFLLYKMLERSKQQYLSLLYLFSPFSWGSNFLLVSDSLFSSFLIISIVLLQRLGLNFNRQVANFENSYITLILTFLVVFFFLLIRETGVLFVGTFLLIALVNKNWKVFLLLAFSLFLYGLFIIYVKFFHIHSQGTNPLSFMQLVDFPFFGLWKSLQNSSVEGKSLIKNFLVILLFCLACLHFTFFEKSLGSFLFCLPLWSYSLLIFIAEEGYCSNYDNLSRFFTPCIPYTILFAREMNIQRKIYFSIVIFLFIIFIFKKILQGFQGGSYFLTLLIANF
ncbi:MAG: hypothetical protein N3A69_02655 [Leptospiraceae bacterium]|nr:hypothetical protein [Leptospiraceae bacterium]